MSKLNVLIQFKKVKKVKPVKQPIQIFLNYLLKYLNLLRKS